MVKLLSPTALSAPKRTGKKTSTKKTSPRKTSTKKTSTKKTSTKKTSPRKTSVKKMDMHHGHHHHDEGHMYKPRHVVKAYSPVAMFSPSRRKATSPKRKRTGRLKKGSPEALAWGRKMQRAKAEKRRMRSRAAKKSSSRRK